MKTSRRTFLRSAAVSGLALSAPAALGSRAATPKGIAKAELDRIVDTPVLDTSFLTKPVTVASVELLRHGKNYLLRTRSTHRVFMKGNA